ncbi:hypothetical protein AB0I52_10995 [Streptomyces sp. NPDC050423]|uniref:hypothetical protein n=1 Tax=Streptomyces sp. NPDC050423 TaxID=3155402 RepID=UPI003413A7B9
MAPNRVTYVLLARIFNASIRRKSARRFSPRILSWRGWNSPLSSVFFESDENGIDNLDPVAEKVLNLGGVVHSDVSDAVACVSDHAELSLCDCELALVKDLGDPREGFDGTDGFDQGQFLLGEVTPVCCVQQTREVASVGDERGVDGAQVCLECMLNGNACMEDNHVNLLVRGPEFSEGQVHEAPAGGQKFALFHVFFHGRSNLERFGYVLFLG